jgi:Ni/Co efflux regulator RcnB
LEVGTGALAAGPGAQAEPPSNLILRRNNIAVTAFDSFEFKTKGSNGMKRTLIALFATAALAIPAVAQQQDPNKNTGQNTSQNQNTGQDQNAKQNTPDPSMDKKSGQSGSVNLSRSQTRMLQRALNSGGLDAGPADGIMGEKTKQAVQKYQSQKGLNASGQLDRETIAALRADRGKQTASRKGSSQGTQPRNQGSQGSQPY